MGAEALERKILDSPGGRKLALLLFILPFFVSLDTSSVWNANEAFYAQTPREMVESGDWLYPTFNDAPRLNKPPLSYWVVAFFYQLFGVHLFWERFAMALLAAVAVGSVWWIGSLLFRPQVALLATGIFATTFRFVVTARRLLIDTGVLAFVLLGIACFLHWERKENPLFLWLSAASFGLAFLTKGPVAFLPLPFLLLYLVARGSWGRLFHYRVPLAGALVLLISSSWFLALGWAEGWEPVRKFFLSENVGRFLDVDYGPRRGFDYYFRVFAADFFPWSILFFAVLILSSFRGGVRRKWWTSPERIFLIAWVAIYVGIFSLSLNKQEYYILPAYPAAALFTAWFLSGRSLPRPFGLFVGLLTGIPGLLLCLLAPRVFSSSAWAWFPALFLILAAVFFCFSRVLLSTLSFSLFFLFGLLIYSPLLEEYRPVETLTREIPKIAAQRGEGDFQPGYYRFTAPSMRFYLDRPIHEVFDPAHARALLTSGEPVYLLTHEEGLRELSEIVGERVGVVRQAPRLHTTARKLGQALRGYLTGEQVQWSRPIYLITYR